MSKHKKKHKPKHKPVPSTGSPTYGGGWIGYGFPNGMGGTCQSPLSGDQFSDQGGIAVGSDGATGSY